MGRGVALGLILFVLPKMWSKLERSLMRLLRAKFGKICQWTKKIKDAVVHGWGTQIFPKSPKENKNSLNMSTAYLLRKIDAQLKRTNISSLFTKAFYQCLHKNLALLMLCGFVCDLKMSLKIGHCRYFWVFRTDQKKKFALVRRREIRIFNLAPEKQHS